MTDELDDEERALLKKHRDAKAKAKADDRAVWIRQGDHEAEVPYSKAQSWLREKFGIDLDKEEVQDPDGDDDQAPDDGKPGTVRRFGRRVG